MTYKEDFDILRSLRDKLQKEFDKQLDRIEESVKNNNIGLANVQLAHLSTMIAHLSTMRRKLRVVDASLSHEDFENLQTDTTKPLVDPEAVIWHRNRLDADIKDQRAKVAQAAETGADEKLLAEREKLLKLKQQHEKVMQTLEDIGF